MFLLQNRGEHGQDISGSLSGASLGLAEDILSRQSQRDCLALNLSGLLKFLLCNALEQSRIETEVSE